MSTVYSRDVILLFFKDGCDQPSVMQVSAEFQYAMQ